MVGNSWLKVKSLKNSGNDANFGLMGPVVPLMYVHHVRCYPLYALMSLLDRLITVLSINTELWHLFLFNKVASLILIYFVQLNGPRAYVKN